MLLKDLEINKRTINAFAKKEIFTIKDLIEYKPRRYYQFKEPVGFNEFKDGVYMAVKAIQLEVDKKIASTGKSYLKFTFKDLDTDNKFYALMFYNVYKFSQYYMNNNKEVVICGKATKEGYYGWSIQNIIDIRNVNDYKPFFHIEYPDIKGVSDATFKKLLNRYLYMSGEILEYEAAEMSGCTSYRNALYGMHHPKNIDDIRFAKERLIFNDLLYFNIQLKKDFANVPLKTKLDFKECTKTYSFLDNLKFKLTEGEGSQKEVVDYIISNALNGIRNDILLQGDVGCGKTIVAIALMMLSFENGYQSVLMTPREILAKQHYEEVKEYADNLGIKTAFLYSGLKTKEKREILKEIKNGEIKFIVGTHSCIAKDVKYNKLGAVITDEEHLFGVNQKEDLIKKSKEGVHSLSMSATPIPRTLANVLYGNQKEIKIISKKPAGRLPIITEGFNGREKVLELMLSEIKKGRQCYVVAPAIEDNEKIELISIEKIYDDYKTFFDKHNVKIGVVNGKMKSDEIKETTNKFINNDIQVLISTTVIEVGVNVPNATMMVIEQAERFGLASLHQLRGRVGRGSYQSYCALLSKNPKNERIKIMCDTNDGFKIAEFDLKQRKSGDLIGTKQSGLNKYVEEMLKYPKLYNRAEKVADYCINNDLGIILCQSFKESDQYKE